MIKLIVFDLDGTLVDSKDDHYYALNKALNKLDPKYVITRDEHLTIYNGLSTSQKLKLLTKNKDLPPHTYENINRRKQKYMKTWISDIYTTDNRIIEILKFLKNKFGYKLYVASNCILETTELILEKKGFIDYIDYYLSNEDVKQPKPSPEIYFKCMIKAGVTCDETLIIEDSEIGLQAAVSSGAHVYRVKHPYDINLNNIINTIHRKEMQKDINIVIPAAGEGSRFANEGYTLPKPLIDVNGKPMIERVIDNLKEIPGRKNFIFIIRKKQKDLKNLLKELVPGCTIVKVVALTQGAACSVLLAKPYINNKHPLIIANSDQLVEAQFERLKTISNAIDGLILTFESQDPKFSYASLDSNKFVDRVAEKKIISNMATTGIYYFRKGSQFVKAAEKMIDQNIRVNNEFYVCPVYNEMIKDNKVIQVFPVDKMWCIGTPQDLNHYLVHNTVANVITPQ